MITEIELDNLMTSAINDLSSDNIHEGVESLVELAHIFAKAGMPMQIFEGIRKHIIDQASLNTDAVFIQEKVKQAEKQHHRLKNSDLIITSVYTH